LEIDKETKLSGKKAEGNIHRVVLGVLSNLPLWQREAVMLRYHDCLEVPEIALAMGSPPQIVATHLSLARKRLETEFDKRSIPRRDADNEPIPMGVIIAEALSFGQREFIPTEAEWIRGTLEKCHLYIFANPAEEQIVSTLPSLSQ